MQRRRWRMCLGAVVATVLVLTFLRLLTPTLGSTQGAEATQHRGSHLTVVPEALPSRGFSLAGAAGGRVFPGLSVGTGAFPFTSRGYVLPFSPNAVAANQVPPGAARAASATPRQGDGAVDYWAVLVGIADFVGTLNDLTYTDDDALDMQALLLGAPNWSSQNIQLLLNSQATKANIQAAIQTMGNNADADDVCVLFYSSHGTTYPDATPLDEADGLDEAICTYNIGTQDILDDELGTWLAQLPTTKYVVMIDTCYSGGQIKGTDHVKGIGSARPAPGDGFATDLVRLWGVGTRDIVAMGRESS